ncbi:Pdip5 protein [Salpingoeca rosetta]|uniref:protein disulfide-isomerase n=1 Tax=Salpingoeca rosetta (strain ATCC 50818 / BSB-021) TaxID=946362 RepID=F2U794_SALR5|nr:Pdip5 protein [Salpingoeca rosetta]EGD83311.1 Pdip5 protein [Salpingoeca rosetta]|eukprot:XP_004994815.1 Pdip5 protein [Salpingoeca rosetta]
MMRTGAVGVAAAATMAVLALASMGRVAAAASDVIELDPTSFNKMLSSDDIWMVEFYAPWCGHCQRLAPEWSKAATALKGVVKMGAVDMTKHQSLGGPYNVQGFPTIKVFGANKKSPSDYNGARTAQALVDAALKEVRSTVTSRLNGGSRRSKSSSGSGSGSGSGGKGAVVELTESSFNKDVLGSDDTWLVAFVAPWCGHCQRLKPEWAKAAAELKGEVKLGQVDATVHTQLASRYGVRGYPTIKVFPGGAKSGEAEDYTSQRDAASIVQFARNLAQANKPPPEVKQVTDEDVFTSHCTDHQICFISFLPDILDTGASGRNDLIAVQTSLAERYKSRPFGWVWAVGGQQPALERAFDVGGFGYPALAAFNSKKKKFAVLRGAYTEDSIKEFVNSLVAGRVPTAAVIGGEVPQVTAITAWDGSDAPEETFEDEIDLSELDDIDLDELDDTNTAAKDEL